MSVDSVVAIVATEVVVVLEMSQYTVFPEESIVCTIVLIPKVCVTVPDKLPAVIVPVAVLSELFCVFVVFF